MKTATNKSFIQLIQSLAKREHNLPEGFVYLSEMDASILQEIRYAGSNNFVGNSVEGYESAKCILTKEAASALIKVQAELKKFGLTLKVFDGYRPQVAVDHFVKWAEDINDTKMKNIYYPEVDKSNLFRDGYIAAKSSHSRGSAVDVTIIQGDGKSLDFGSEFDFFGLESHTANPNLTFAQRQNRLFLKVIMEKFGFKGIEEEWWHFSLVNEPYPDTYFTFPII